MQSQLPPKSAQTIYVESEIMQHHRTQSIIGKFQNPCIIECDSYREVFNPKSHNFRLQKNHPALILALKHDNHIQPSPYSLKNITAHTENNISNFYFSHMLGCIYDCSYCFLQAMYSSAHYVVFVNFEDFFSSIAKKIKELEAAHNSESSAPQNELAYFFSGYDCDSLAYEPITNFTREALPFFAEHPQAFLELRTKSLQTKFLSKIEPINNCIVAFSLAPEEIAKEYEQGTPSPKKRIAAMSSLAKQGWLVGARLDPMIWHENWQDSYAKLIDDIAKNIGIDAMHSITIGSLRFPKSMAAKMTEYYPKAKFLHNKMIVSDSALQMESAVHHEMMDFCQQQLSRHYPPEIIVPNQV